MNSAAATEWLQTVLQNLAEAGFVVSEPPNTSDPAIRAVARRTRLELTKFGFSETFFVFRQFESLTLPALRKFSSDAFRFAKKTRKIPLPCGLLESVWCFAVAIAERADSETTKSVRNDVPPKHWAAAEMPVVYHVTDGSLDYFQKTPLWGAAYYSGFRTQIQQLLDS
jgi:hypothetical protein